MTMELEQSTRWSFKEESVRSEFRVSSVDNSKLWIRKIHYIEHSHAKSEKVLTVRMRGKYKFGYSKKNEWGTNWQQEEACWRHWHCIAIPTCPLRYVSTLSTLAPCVTAIAIIVIFPYALSPIAWVTQRSRAMKRTLYCFTHLCLVLRFNTCWCSSLKHWLHLFKYNVSYCTIVSMKGTEE